MTPQQLAEIVSRLPARQPITDEFESSEPAGHRSWAGNQQQHLYGWLMEYNTPGAYGRSKLDSTAADFYRSFRNVGGLLWLAEALGEDPAALRDAVAAVRTSGKNYSSQCAAFRQAVSWSRIEELLELRSASTGMRWVRRPFQRTTIRAAMKRRQ